MTTVQLPIGMRKRRKFRSVWTAGYQINIISAFDGMSCGQIALNRAGIPYNNYYAFEIDKWASKVARENYPNTWQLGDITRWDAWGLTDIDLLMGGSPCQGFSIAGKRLNFDDPRSKLFFTFVDMLKHYRPRYFLLENVARMSQKVQSTISEMLGVEPIKINSALVSAQNRRRLYWTNIPGVRQPEDRGIVLADILEGGLAFKTKSQTIPATIYKENAKSMVKRGKFGLLVRPHGYNKGALLYDKTGSITTKSWEDNNHLIDLRRYSRGCQKRIKKNSKKSCEKSIALCGNSNITGSGTTTIDLEDHIHYRKLTPLECERLQTVPDGYTSAVSNTQRYKMLGNGWTVDVIAHILKNMHVT